MSGGIGKMYKGLDFNGNSITGLADASISSGAATWGQVQAFVRGMIHKDGVDAASTANIANLASPGASIDGVTFTDGRRYLLKDQSTASQNGIYVYTLSTTTLARASDMLAGVDSRGFTVPVRGGTTNDDRTFTVTSDPAIVGTDAITWTQLGGGGATYTAGDGLTESPANQFNVNAGIGLEMVSDAIRIAASAAGDGLTGGAGSPIAVGAGAGIGVTANAIAVDGTIPRRFTNSATHSGGSTVSLTHSLGHRDYAVSVCIDATGEDITSGVDITKGLSTVDVVFSATQSANTIRVTVIG